jgi:nitrate/nitrite-specific signal transduction histidine kinase
VSDSHDDLESRRKEFVESFLKKGAEFAEELLRENERLRFRVASVEQQLAATTLDAPTPGTLKELVERIHALEQEREKLLARFAHVEAENKEYVSRFREIERENNNLASLYVAAHQLHSTFELREVLQVVIEIVLNFVGAKTFAIYLVDEEAKLLRAVAAEGIAREELASRPIAGGVLGQVTTSGEPHYGARTKSAAVDPRKDEPAIAVPLRIRDRAVGVIGIWELLAQKTELLEVDYEIFQLLGAHAASALEAARLAAEAAQAGPGARLSFGRLAETLT